MPGVSVRVCGVRYVSLLDGSVRMCGVRCKPGMCVLCGMCE